MKRYGGVALLAAVSTCAVAAYAKQPVAQAKSIVLPLSDARAACDVAIEYVFFQHSWHRAEVVAAKKSKSSLPNIFLEAYDNIGREVTPASTIAKLREEGLNVCPAWAEKKRRAEKKRMPHNDPETFGGCWYIRLSRMKFINKNKVQWYVEDWGAPLPNYPDHKGVEGSPITEFLIQLQRANGKWKVVAYRQTAAAG